MIYFFRLVSPLGYFELTTDDLREVNALLRQQLIPGARAYMRYRGKTAEEKQNSTQQKRTGRAL